MKKNVASQVVGVQMVNATTGAAFTSAVTVAVTGDAGVQATGSVGSGACTHEGNGFHTYAPAQAETNYDHVAFTFTGTGAIPVTVQVFPTFPQTGDSYARIGATGSGLTSLASQASVDTVDDFLDTEIADIRNRLPAALVGGRIDANVGAISSDATAADNAEAFFDGTGYAGTNNVIPLVTTTTTVTNEVTANVTKISGDSAAADNLESYTDGTTPMPVNVTQVSGDATAADRLEALMDGLIVGQVNDAAATTTSFIADGFTEATNDHFNGRLITFLSGALTGQQTAITDYVGGTQAFTVTALTEAPADDVFFVIH